MHAGLFYFVIYNGMDEFGLGSASEDEVLKIIYLPSDSERKLGELFYNDENQNE